jgi:hypothetical protein
MSDPININDWRSECCKAKPINRRRFQIFYEWNDDNSEAQIKATGICPDCGGRTPFHNINQPKET